MKWHCSWRRLLGSILMVACAAPAFAADPYYLDVYLNGNTGNPDFARGYSKLENAIDTLNVSTLQSINYTGSEQLDVKFFLRGVDGLINYGSGSSDLSFTLDNVFFNNGRNTITFTATNAGAGTAAERANTLDQLKDYLKRNKDALKAILTAMAARSPIDPLAGNPDSLFSQRMRNDFNYGFTNKVSQIWGCGASAFNFTNDQPLQVAAVGSMGDIFADAQARAAALQAENEVGLGILASETSAKTGPSATPGAGGTMMTTELTLPFSYTAKFDSDPRKKLRFDLPVTYATTEGATSYMVGAGIAYTQPLSDMWSLSPAIGLGATGSPDLGSAGGVGSYSLTSAYTWRFDSLALSMGNSVGRYQSVAIKMGGYEAAADIKNTAFTNGFMLTGPNSLLARNMVVEYSIVDTRITGTELYSDAYDEIGIAIGHISTEMGIITSYTKFGLSYLIATGGPENINSVRLALTSRF